MIARPLMMPVWGESDYLDCIDTAHDLFKVRPFTFLIFVEPACSEHLYIKKLLADIEFKMIKNMVV